MVRLDGAQLFHFLLVAVGLVLLAVILLPFWSALLLAAVLAGVFQGWQRRLARKLGGRGSIAAAMLTIGVLLAIVLPLGGITALLAREVVHVVESVREVFQDGGVNGLLDRLPSTLRGIAERGFDAIGGPGGRGDVLKVVQSQSGKAAAAATSVLSATSRVAVESVLMLVAFYFLLLDGPKLVRWLERVAPLPPGRFRQFLGEFRQVSRAVVVSTVGTAGVQAVVALVGFLLARVPNPLFFTLLTFFVAFIPSIGAASVPVVLSVVLFAQGRVGWAIFLLAWGVVVVGLVDNVVKPLFIRGGVEMHGAVVFFALLGGLAAFGPIGLVAGPLVVAFFLALASPAGASSDRRDAATPPAPAPAS